MCHSLSTVMYNSHDTMSGDLQYYQDMPFVSLDMAEGGPTIWDMSETTDVRVLKKHKEKKRESMTLNIVLPQDEDKTDVIQCYPSLKFYETPPACG